MLLIKQIIFSTCLILLKFSVSCQEFITFKTIDLNDEMTLPFVDVYFGNTHFQTDSNGIIVLEKNEEHSLLTFRRPGLIYQQVALKNISSDEYTVALEYTDSAQFLTWHIKDSINAIIWKEIDSRYLNDDTRSENNGISYPMEAAKFPEDSPTLSNYLGLHLHYPQFCVSRGIEGKVYLKFIVETDGQITNVKVMKGAHKALDREAIRVVRNMPNWIPGKSDGKAVRSFYILPITFGFN